MERTAPIRVDFSRNRLFGLRGRIEMIAKCSHAASPFQLAALDASNVGTWDLDVGADVFRCDAVAASIYGLSDHESVVGVPLDRAGAAVHPEDRAMWQARRNLSLRHGGMFVIEYRVVPRPGDVRWVLVRGRYDIRSDGGTTRARGIVIDLTESKRDGFADGYATFLDPQSEDSDLGALERAATHAIGAHRALSELKRFARPSLRMATDRLLQEVGLAIAMTGPLGDCRPSRH